LEKKGHGNLKGCLCIHAYTYVCSGTTYAC